jgi:polysaccharide deacetylase 2 family uncharacterized protein YibQ
VRPVYAALGALVLFLGAFAAVAIFNSDPFGGEPMARVAITPPAAPAKTATAKAPEPAMQKAAEPAVTTPQAPGRRITIIDGSSGKRQEVTVPDAAPDATPAPVTGGDQTLLEKSRHGLLPAIGADGVKPSRAYAATPPASAATLPNIAIVVTGLGVGAAKTTDAIMKLPGAVTLAFTPYGADPSAAVTRARAQGHEVLLQLPMEPFDYPDNDPGPQTLLVDGTAEQNLDRAQYHMTRFQGYVGLANYMGARYAASEPAMRPLMQELARRGLIYFDDGAAPRTVSRQTAEGHAVAFAQGDVAIDAVPSAAEIDRALARLEGIARQRGAAIGVASGLPVSIERIALWAKALEAKGLALVPLTAALPKAKSS